MSRIKERFATLAAEGRSALIPYMTAGDPAPWVTVPLMHALVKAGADIIELGVPFSDPMADGPVIQRATERALKHKVTLSQVLADVRTFREQDKSTPVVLMGYLNPYEAMGYARFAAQASEAGVDGVLAVDLPPEEADEFLGALRAKGLDAIFLIAPTSNEDRMAQIGRLASGFLYYVSLRGVTGAKHLDLTEVESRLRTIRHHTHLPLGVGFGISSPDAAAAVARFADAVIVGSAVVRRIEERTGDPEAVLRDVPAFVAQLRSAMDNAKIAASA